MEHEIYAYRKSLNYKAEASDNIDDPKEAERERKKEQAKIDAAEPFTDSDEDEKEELLSEGFRNWVKREFNSFVRGCEKYGRSEYESIAKDIGTKTAEEVKEYSDVFWERGHEIADYPRHLANIERGELQIYHKKNRKLYLERKVNRYTAPYHQLQVKFCQRNN